MRRLDGPVSSHCTFWMVIYVSDGSGKEGVGSKHTLTPNPLLLMRKDDECKFSFIVLSQGK